MTWVALRAELTRMANEFSQCGEPLPPVGWVTPDMLRHHEERVQLHFWEAEYAKMKADRRTKREWPRGRRAPTAASLWSGTQSAGRRRCLRTARQSVHAPPGSPAGMQSTVRSDGQGRRWQHDLRQYPARMDRGPGDEGHRANGLPCTGCESSRCARGSHREIGLRRGTFLLQPRRGPISGSEQQEEER